MCPTEPLLREGAIQQTDCLGAGWGSLLSPLPSQVAKDSRVAAAWPGHAVCAGTVSPGKGEAAEHY